MVFCVRAMAGLFLLHCCLATPLFGGYKPALAMDFKGASYLFDGYKPTTRRKATIGCRTALPIEVTIKQGKAVLEYAKTLVTPAKLEASVLQVHYVCQMVSGSRFSPTMSSGVMGEFWSKCTARLSGSTSKL